MNFVIFGKATKMAKNKAPNKDSRVKVFFKKMLFVFQVEHLEL